MSKHSIFMTAFHIFVDHFDLETHGDHLALCVHMKFVSYSTEMPILIVLSLTCISWLVSTDAPVILISLRSYLEGFAELPPADVLFAIQFKPLK